MQKLTIYKIKDKLAIEYKPIKTKDMEPLAKDLFQYDGKIYQYISESDIPNLFKDLPAVEPRDQDSLW